MHCHLVEIERRGGPLSTDCVLPEFQTWYVNMLAMFINFQFRIRTDPIKNIFSVKLHYTNFNHSDYLKIFNSQSDCLSVKLSSNISLRDPDQIALFFKWANPGLFFVYFHLFKHTLQILQRIGMCKNVHLVYSAGIRSTTFGM